MILALDIETYSETDLTRAGVYRYAEDPAFQVLLLGYSVDGEAADVLDLAQGDAIPPWLLTALTDPEVEKWAFNAQFERVCLSRLLRDMGLLTTDYIDPAGWRCTMVLAATLGLPLSLEQVGSVLSGVRQKLQTGRELIRKFSKPMAAAQPTQTRDLLGDRQAAPRRRMPNQDPEGWAAFIEYNRRDVETECDIRTKLLRMPTYPDLWTEYLLDQQINDRGIRIDTTLATQAIQLDAQVQQQLTTRMKAITQLANPNSVAQMKGWLADKGLVLDSLGKAEVSAAMADCPPDLQEVLQLRQMAAKSSTKKYQAMLDTVCRDGRARGMFQFYGAARTGRWAGRLIQMQNLPQNRMTDLAEARALLRSGKLDAFQMLYDNCPAALSELIRTAFIPAPGHQLLVADFSAIEARVIAWLAGEQWRLDLFAQGGDIYCQSASQMFGVPVVKHGTNGHLRQKGKIAELACGYGGSVGALKAMGALEMGIPETELKPLVDAWRSANPRIVRLWWDVDAAVTDAVSTGGTSSLHGITIHKERGILTITLPSSRPLRYMQPAIGQNQIGGQSVTYMGLDTARRWGRIESYGPKFVENIVQAISRDLLMAALQRVQGRIVGHVHDEIILETPDPDSLDTVCQAMGETPPWAAGLTLRADGYITDFYQKD